MDVRGKNGYVKTSNRKAFIHKDYGRLDVYRWWRKQKPYFDISKDLYRKVCYEMSELILKELIFNNYKYQMPCGMGWMDIVKKKYKLPLNPDGTICKRKMKIDWGRTNKYWKEHPEMHGKKMIYHLNEHSDGYIARFRWHRKSRIKGISAYRLEAARWAKTELAKFIKNIKAAPYFEAEFSIWSKSASD